jgi:hypothetical protein
MDCFRVTKTIMAMEANKTTIANCANSGIMVVPVIVIDSALAGISLITIIVMTSLITKPIQST